MLRLSRSTDYALMALSDLALLPGGETRSARRVAEERGLPAELVAKILQGLRKAGLVSTRQGIRGGYRLSRPPTGISLTEVIEAVEGPLALVECGLDDHNCGLTSTCCVRTPLTRVHDLVVETLSRLTLDQFLPDPEVRPEVPPRGRNDAPAPGRPDPSITDPPIADSPIAAPERPARRHH